MWSISPLAWYRSRSSGCCFVRSIWWPCGNQHNINITNNESCRFCPSINVYCLWRHEYRHTTKTGVFIARDSGVFTRFLGIFHTQHDSKSESRTGCRVESARVICRFMVVSAGVLEGSQTAFGKPRFSGFQGRLDLRMRQI